MIDIGNVKIMKNSGKLSPKYQIAIPKEVRESLNWKVGQKLVFLPKEMVCWSFRNRRSKIWLAGGCRGAIPEELPRSQRPLLMRVVDTSAWIEWVRKTSVGASLRPELPPKDRWLVPTIVQFELARWLRREVTAEVENQVLAFSKKCNVAALDTRLALQAADVARSTGLAMADAIVYATAQENGADLLTCDAHFAKLDKDIYFPKAAT